MTGPEVEELRGRLLGNLDRVRGLIALYDEVACRVQGRPSVRESDLLRAAVILLHASIEDLFRTIAAARMPLAGRDVLETIPFARGDGRKTTLTLGDLAAFRGRTVDDVISESVDAYLDRRSYNDTVDLAAALSQSLLSPDLVKPHAAQLQALMNRRHLIAHRLDREIFTGRGRHPARSLSRATVESWLGVVDKFGCAVLDSLAGH